MGRRAYVRPLAEWLAVSLGPSPFSDLPLAETDLSRTNAAWVSGALGRPLTLAEVHLVTLVCDAFRVGAYDLRWTSLEGWGSRAASVSVRGDLATVDRDRLTRLVVLAHDRALRLEVEPHTFTQLRLTIHRRFRRRGELSERVPTIEDAVAHVHANPWRR